MMVFMWDGLENMYINGFIKFWMIRIQQNVNMLFILYRILYGSFDEAVFHLDRKATQSEWFPRWFMTGVSILGLGFQLLIISVMLVLEWAEYIVPFFIFYSVFIFVFIGIRKYYEFKFIDVPKKGYRTKRYSF